MNRLVYLMALACLLGGSAQAETFAVAPQGKYELDLDTPDGAFSVWQLNDLTVVNALRAKVTVRRVGKDRKWSPSFGFSLKTGTETAHFKILSVRAGAPLVMILTHQKGEAEVSNEMFLTFLDVNETADLLFDWTPSGEITIRIGSKQTREISQYETHKVSLAGAPISLRITSSTGELELKPLEIGRSTP